MLPSPGRVRPNAISLLLVRKGHRRESFSFSHRHRFGGPLLNDHICTPTYMASRSQRPSRSRRPFRENFHLLRTRGLVWVWLGLTGLSSRSDLTADFAVGCRKRCAWENMWGAAAELDFSLRNRLHIRQNNNGILVIASVL